MATVAPPPIDRVGPADLVMLAMGTSSVPEQLGGVLQLDEAEEFDLGAARKLLAERITTIPRLRQLLRTAPPLCGNPIGVDDARFDAEQHIEHVVCPAPGDEPALLDIAAGVLIRRLPHDRPKRAAVFVTGLAHGRVALVIVLDHVLADGLGAARAGRSGRRCAAGAPTAVPASGARHLGTVRRRLPSAWERDRGARAPEGPPARAHATARAGIAANPAAARCSLLQPTGSRRTLAVVRCDLTALHNAAHARGATVDDAYLTAVTGALHKLLRRRGESVTDIVAGVPISRGGEGNRGRAAQPDRSGAGGPARGGPTDERLQRTSTAMRTRKAAVSAGSVPAQRYAK